MSLRRKPKPCRCREYGRTLCSCNRTPMKRTPMKRTGSTLKRSGRINPVSAKRRAENRERKAMREQHFGVGQDRPACAIRWDENCTRFADGLHELKKRSAGGSVTDPANCVPACNRCNSMIENEPDEAYRRGWVINSWEG